MDTIHKTNFDIDTSNLQTGTHEIKLQTNILDTKCESSILQQDSVQLLIKEPFQDTTPPQITILTPQQTILNTNTINFAFIVTDQSPIQSCSLLINGITEQTSTNIQTPHTFTQFLSDGNYAFQIECTDSAANTAQTPPITITVDTQPQIQNTPPTLSSLDLTQNPTTASILECIASPQDTEQSSVRVIFTWYKNGLFHLLENIACTAGQNCDSQIPSQETQKQDTWTCIAQAYDSLLYSQALQAITKILNSNPTSQAIPNIQFQQGQSATLDLNNYFSDPDNDPLTFTAASNELTITINNGIATFTSPNWCGQTQITFTASDNSQSIQEQATAIVACSPTPPIPPTPEPEDKHKKEIQKIKIAQAIIKDNQLFIKTSSNKETQAQLTIISETNLIKKDIQLNRATEWYIFPFTENYAIIKLKSNSQEIKTFTTA